MRLILLRFARIFEISRTSERLCLYISVDLILFPSASIGPVSSAEVLVDAAIFCFFQRRGIPKRRNSYEKDRGCFFSAQGCIFSFRFFLRRLHPLKGAPKRPSLLGRKASGRKISSKTFSKSNGDAHGNVLKHAAKKFAKNAFSQRTIPFRSEKRLRYWSTRRMAGTLATRCSRSAPATSKLVRRRRRRLPLEWR